MKIAVVSPSPVPFTIGGAENLAWGLCEAINKHTDHQAELIKLPVKERSFWDLVESYYSFYKLDLSHFDLVISTKYPAWMIQHPNCMVYMLHTLRGLYDTYFMMGKPEEVPQGIAPVDELLRYMQDNTCEAALDTFFQKLFRLKDDPAIPSEYFEFPGALIRKIVHYLDRCALSQSGMKKWSAISNVVKNRKDYFPDGTFVQVVYPPTVLKSFEYLGDDYLFMCSRLDSAKRIDMLIKAMRYVKSDVRLLIAGTGPEREHLEQLAQQDKRIEFLGFVSDEDVDRHYANAICIPYFPYDEDYGYITVEAMLHKKPVITTKDSGGPNEFVKDGETGFSVEFDEQKIAEKIDYLVQHKDAAKKMGEAAYQVVNGITWESAVEKLLGECEARGTKSRKKMIVTNTFTIYPVMGGGQARAYNLYKNLAKQMDVKFIDFDIVTASKRRKVIAEGLEEIVIPKSEKHQEEESKIERALGVPVTDVVMPFLGDLTPDFGKVLSEEAKDADVIVVSHPYTYELVKKYGRNLPVVYEAQDVEYHLKKAILPKDNKESERLLDKVYQIEKECCQKSEFILTCSEPDKESLVELYGIDSEKIIVIPNGVDCDETAFTGVDERIEEKEKEGLAKEKIGIFMGSWHGPNLEASEKIIELAPKCPKTKFMLMGSQCLYFANRKLPANVGLLGMVSDEEKARIFRIVDFALNPMLSGSGTNLKMFDYMSAGIPVISTGFGTRGIDDKEAIIVAEVDQMADVINDFKLEDYRKSVAAARKYVENVFDWKVISKPFADRMNEVIKSTK